MVHSNGAVADQRDDEFISVQLYETGGEAALVEVSRCKPILKNRVAPGIEEAVVEMAFDYPAYGQSRDCNELRKQGIFISAASVRRVWQRHDLEIFEKRLKALEARIAQEGLILSEARMLAMERKKEREKLWERSRLNIPAISVPRILITLEPLKA